jgi:hypothetical protein
MILELDTSVSEDWVVSLLGRTDRVTRNVVTHSRRRGF